MRFPCLYRAFIVAGVVAYYLAVQAVWLLFAAHAYAWVPYRLVWLL